MEYKKLLLELLHRTEAISITLQEILSENNLNTALEHLNKKKGMSRTRSGLIPSFFIPV